MRNIKNESKNVDKFLSVKEITKRGYRTQQEFIERVVEQQFSSFKLGMNTEIQNLISVFAEDASVKLEERVAEFLDGVTTKMQVIDEKVQNFGALDRRLQAIELDVKRKVNDTQFNNFELDVRKKYAKVSAVEGLEEQVF
jgi:hypothetical protein